MAFNMQYAWQWNAMGGILKSLLSIHCSMLTLWKRSIPTFQFEADERFFHNMAGHEKKSTNLLFFEIGSW